MAKEIERKFLVGNDGWRANAGPGTTISQFYVAASADRSVRVRIVDGRSALVALKFGGSVRERDEFEYEIPVADARDMERFAIGTIIEKTRHLSGHGGRAYEIDIFKRGLAGLAIAELETAEEVGAAELPPWLGREVTGEAGFYNLSLALRGLPEIG